ncbi:MAG: hypothetical protein M1833_004590 [Piccolia ochrophora]|nr:MAG: hypothetical protein M1833_004590 [Piccolia ochrophora]
MFNPLIVSDLFRAQSGPWEQIVQGHVKTTWRAARAFLESAIIHLTNEDTAVSLLNEVIDPMMEEKNDEMQNKILELLNPYKKGHPITYNHYFTETIQDARLSRQKAELKTKLETYFEATEPPNQHSRLFELSNLSGLLSALSINKEADMDRYACSEMLDCMQAYYKVAMKSVVDNVAIHAIESVLIADLCDILSPISVMQMEPKMVSRIAAESQENQTQREQLSRSLTILQNGLRICKQYADRDVRALTRLPETARHDNMTGTRNDERSSSSSTTSDSDSVGDGRVETATRDTYAPRPIASFVRHQVLEAMSTHAYPKEEEAGQVFASPPSTQAAQTAVNRRGLRSKKKKKVSARLWPTSPQPVESSDLVSD